jgi:hypothetical protein
MMSAVQCERGEVYTTTDAESSSCGMYIGESPLRKGRLRSLFVFDKDRSYG